VIVFMRRVVPVIVGASMLAAACSGGDGRATGPRTTKAPPPKQAEIFFAGHKSDVYSSDSHWLCRPDLAGDPCSHDLDATVVAANGALTPEPFVPAAKPAFDCFYVYPTVRLGTEGNAQFDGNYKEETFTVRTQAARFGTKCGVYAPLYRQRTLTAPANPSVDYSAIAYADVLDAFRYYLGNLNQGRPFVLMGHSQGASHLRRLIAEQIDPDPKLRGRLISALLLGGAVGVPAGKNVGGSFKNVAACRAPTDVGCVVSYSSFRSTRPPPADSLFGRVREPGQRAVCTNPANLGGGPGALVSYFDARGTSQLIGRAFHPFAADVAHPPEISTPFVALPGLVSAACVDAGSISYLELTVHPDPGPRVDDIGGDLTAQWGMHLVDMNVALGNLVDLVGQQAKAWAAAH
jgi:hypothetical protein